ncbi:MAG: ferritin-like protein [Methylobacter sp.]
MLLIKVEIIERLRAAKNITDIQGLLAAAYAVELATLPTYLTGAFSVKPGYNQEALALVQSVAYEEMLHMTLACNLLIAIGGNPDILKTGLSLQFPTPLPLGVDEGLTVSLRPLNKLQVQEVYMGIERPDTKAILPGETCVHPLSVLKDEQGYASIGDFYDAILAKLAEFTAAGNDPFADPRTDRQVDITDWFPPTRCGNGKVTNLYSAKAVVDTILVQGEGANVGDDPIDPTGGFGGSFAHYFKFGEIYNGRRLIQDSAAASGWSYSGAPVALDEQGVYDFLPNAAVSDYVPGSAAHVAAVEFYNVYKRLLASLDRVFNGAPDELKSALGVMYELKLVAQKVAQCPAYPAEPAGPVAAPPFMLTH